MMPTTRRGLLALLVPLVVLSGCEGDSFEVPWALRPEESTLYSLDRAELNRPSAFDLYERVGVVLEDPFVEGRWDFAVERQGGVLHLIPPGYLGETSGAGIVPMPGMTYDQLIEAPADTALYRTQEPVALAVGDVFVIRSHRQLNEFGFLCSFYGRIEALEVDHSEGVFVFKHDRSPDCNNRQLIPPGM